MTAVKRILYTLVFVIVMITGLLFFLKNNQVMQFDYIIGTIELPVSLLLLGCVCAGALLGMLAMLPLVLRLKRQKSRLQRQARNAEKEINNLRVLPVRDPH